MRALADRFVVSNPAALAAVEYEAEATPNGFGENVTTFATHRLPVRAQVDISGLKHDKVDAERVVQFRNDGTQWVLMTQAGSTFKTLLDVPGHGATTSGTPTIDPIEVIYGYVFGNVELSAAQSTTLTGGTASVPTTTASGTFDAGGLCVVGTLGDGRGNGQMYPIATHITTNLTLLAALDGAPTNGDVLFPAVEIYPSEIPTNAGLTGSVHPTPAPGLRFRLLTANLRYECHGCYPIAVAFSGLATKGRPQCEITWAVSWWAYSTATFPSVVTSNAYNPAAVAAGSFFLNDFGTVTRVKRSIRDFKLDYTLGMVPLEGPGGVNQFQACVGCRRIPDKIKLSWSEDADAATTTPVLPGFGTATTFKHIMYTLSTTAGSRVGFYFPRVAITNVAIQRMDNNINRLMVEAEAQVSTTTTNDLTLSAMRMGFA